MKRKRRKVVKAARARHEGIPFRRMPPMQACGGMQDLLQIKEAFLLRNREYVQAAAELAAGFPKDLSRATDADRRRLRAFLEKWDVPPASPSCLRRAPFGQGVRATHTTYGILLLSDADSDIVVVGIDVTHNVRDVCAAITRLVQDTRDHREASGDSPGRWRQPARGEKFIKEACEALRVWDLRQTGKSLAEIRDILYPAYADPKTAAEATEEMDPELNPESALKTVKRRLKFAEEHVASRYREIAPLVGSRFRELITQWEESVGYRGKSGQEPDSDSCPTPLDHGP